MRAASPLAALLVLLLGAAQDTRAAPAAAAGAGAGAASAAGTASWSLIVGSPASSTRLAAPPGQHFTAALAHTLASGGDDGAACAAAAHDLHYAGVYAVSPPLAKQQQEQHAELASEVLLWYAPATSAQCTASASAASADAGGSLRIDAVLPQVGLGSPSPKHLVFVAQEALDHSLLDKQRSNASWASPMLLKHAASVSGSEASQLAIKRNVAEWTWEQQMRALLGESSLSEAEGDHNVVSLQTSTSAGANVQQVFSTSAKRAPQGEGIARVTDIHTLHEHVRLIHLDQYWALVQMDDAALLSHELFLPTDSRVALVPTLDSLPSASTSSSNGIASAAANASEPRYATPAFSSLISSVLASHQISTKRLEQDTRVLTAEDANPGWVTRHSATEGGRKAADWILQQLSSSLEFVSGAECHLHEYDPIFSPNVVCTIKADPEAAAAAKEDGKGEEPDGLVLLSAHLDSRGSFGYIEAPGGDDDGSGTTLLLGVARVIGEYRMRFARDVHLVAHTGEEQGLIGSKYYARHLREKKLPVRLALQADMVAFRKPGEPAQLAFPNRLATETATKYVQSLAQLYTPELVVGYCTACCSDHQSYWEEGFAATWLFERNGAIADYAYHQSYDTTNRTGYDFEQLRGATKVALATVLETAHFYL